MRRNPVLVVNAASHDLRLSVVSPPDTRVWRRHVNAPAESAEAAAFLAAVLDEVGDIGAVGHRIVHGGDLVVHPTLVDDEVVDELLAVQYLAPRQMEPALRLLIELRGRIPDRPHVAVVDTAFHASLPEPSRTYALPAEWRSRWDLRRYGFHGLSYGSALPRAAALVHLPVAEFSGVIAHLGSSSSVCAVQEGRSVWTSMGNTPLEGLVMETCSGSVDPGLLLNLIDTHGLTVGEVRTGLDDRSGLFGLSDGLSGDTRTLDVAARDGSRSAQLALDAFCQSVAREIAAAATALDQMDALVFTGEIGADEPDLRQAICVRLRVLGIKPGLRRVAGRDQVISFAGATIPVLCLTVEEDLQAAKEVRSLLDDGP